MVIHSTYGLAGLEAHNVQDMGGWLVDSDVAALGQCHTLTYAAP